MTDYADQIAELNGVQYVDLLAALAQAAREGYALAMGVKS